MPILKMADLSTAHVSPADREVLSKLASEPSKHSGAPLVIDYDGVGWIVSLAGFSSAQAEHEEAALEAGLSEAFLDVIRFGVRHDVEIIRIDRDVVPEPDLFPEYADAPTPSF